MKRPPTLLVLALAGWPIALFAQAPPTAGKLPLRIGPEDVVSTRIRSAGGRTVTFLKLDPEVMEKKVAETAPLPSPLQVAVDPERSGPERAMRPSRQCRMGASVMVGDKAHPEQAVTRLVLWSEGAQPVATLWVNANFLWLSGLQERIETEEGGIDLLMMVSPGAEELPENLPFPADGRVALVIAEGNPSEADLAPIDRLLEIYERDRVALRENYERRLREGAAVEAARRADPPEKKNMVIRFWREPERSSKAAGEEGRP